MAAWHQLDPYPDARLGDIADGLPAPGARYGARESLSLAFVAALHNLTPGQRAVLVLRDVLGFTAAEAADILARPPGTVNGMLTRARAAFAVYLARGENGRPPPPGSFRERAVVTKFAESFERGDVAGIVALLTDDARLTMPPLPLEYRGRAAAGRYLSAISFRAGMRRFRLVETRANGQPAYGCYLRDDHAPVAHGRGLIVLTLSGEQICVVSSFLDCAMLAHFGLPGTLRD